MLLTLFLLSVRAPQANPSQDEFAAVRAIFHRSEGASQARDDVLVRRLVALGATAAPALFDLVTGAGVEALLVDDASEAWLCPPDRVGELALAALGELPQVPVRELLRTRCRETPTREVRIAALNVLGRQASTEGLAFLLELCNASGIELEQRSVHVPALDALSAMLHADKQAIRALEAPLLAADPVLQRLGCEALAQSGRPEALGLLLKLIGHAPELDLAALEGLTELGQRFPWTLGDPVATRLRAMLDKGTPELRCAVAHALGSLRDGQAVPGLITSLAETNPDVQTTALWALREITGETHTTKAKDWLAWLKREQAWWAESGEAALAALDPAAPENLSGALRELARHPIGRNRVSDALCDSLERFSPEAQALVCDTLARLDARRAVPALVELLSSADEIVRATACAALRQLTGEDLPAEPHLWEEYVSG